MCLGLLCELLTGLGRLVLKMAGWGWAQVMRQDGIAASLGPFVTSVLFLSQQLKTSAPLHMATQQAKNNHGPR